MGQINEYPIVIDVESGAIYRDFLSPVEVNLPDIKQGDTIRVVLMGVRASRIDPRRPLEYVDLPSNIAVGIGEVAARPEQGNFTLLYNSEETANLAYNAEASAVQTALNALTAIGANNVAVSGPDGGPYRVTWQNTGARNTIQSDTTDLYPPTATSIYVSREGDSNKSEIQTIVLERDLAAFQDNFSNLPVAAVTVTTLQHGATNVPEVQRVDIGTPLPYGGTFSLTFDGVATGAIPYDVDNATLEATLEGLSTIGANNVSVSGAFPRWDITFDGLTGNQNTITAEPSGLLVPIGKYADLSLSTDGIAIMVANSASVDTTLEIEFPDYPQTYQKAVRVLNDLIPSAPSSPTPLPEYYTSAEVNLLLADKANIASPTFTGTPLAPTAASGTNTTQIATTAFVQAAFAAPPAIGNTTPNAGAFTSLTLTPANNITGLTLTGGTIAGSGITPFASITGSWNTTGSPTALKVDISDTASDSASKLLDLMVGGSSKVSVRKDGQIVSAGEIFGNTVTAYNGLKIEFSGINMSNKLGVGCDDFGIMRLIDLGFSGNPIRIRFGGDTSSFPMLKQVSSALYARLADDSDYAAFRAATLFLSALPTSDPGTPGSVWRSGSDLKIST